jgi:hypothetical protein
MAVVGEAHIIVRAITTRVKQDIKKGFDGIDGSTAARAGENLGQRMKDAFSKSTKGNWFGKMSDAIGEMAPNAEAAREQMNQLIMSGYKMQAMIAVILPLIGLLGGALMALVGAAGGAAASFTAFIGVLMAFKVGLAVAKQALSGVGEAVQAAIQQQQQYGSVANASAKALRDLKYAALDAALGQEQASINLQKAREGLQRVQDLPVGNAQRRQAELDFKQAELALQKATDTNKDAKKALASGDTTAVGYQDPFKDLTPSQKKFAQYLVTIQKEFKKLKEAAAAGFLPALENVIKRLMASGFPVLLKGVAKISTALGKAVTLFTDGLLNPKTGNLKTISNIFTILSSVIVKLGPILANALTAFLKIIEASGPIINEFTNWIGSIASEFAASMTKLSKNGELKKFFNDAGKVAAQFGRLFGNIFDGLIAVIDANFREGQGGYRFVKFLADASEGIFTLGKGKKGLETFFNDIADNAIILFDGLGKVFGTLLEIGATKELGVFFQDLKDTAVPALKEIIEKSLPILPVLGKLGGQIARVLNLLADSKAPSIFFDVLLKVATVVGDLLQIEAVQWFLGITASIKAVSLAVGKVTDVFKQVGGFITGSVQSIFDFFDGLTKVFQQIGAYYKSVKKAIKAVKEWGGWEKIKNATLKASIFIQKVYEKTVLGIANGIKKLGKWIASWGIWEKIKNGIVAVSGTVHDMYTYSVTRIKTAIASLGKWIASWSIWEKLKSGWLAVSATVHDMYTFSIMKIRMGIARLVTWVGSWNLIERLKNAGLALSITIHNAYTASITAIGTAISKVIALMRAWFSAEKLKQTGQILGSAIQTAYTTVINATRLAVTQLAASVAAWTIWERIRQAATVVGTAIQAAFNAVLMMNPFVLLALAIAAVVAALVYFFGFTETGKKAWEGFIGWLSNMWNGFIDLLKLAGDFIASVFVNIMKNTGNLMITLVNIIIAAMNALLKPLDLVGQALGAITGGNIAFSAQIPYVPYLAKGGVVSPKRGGTLAMIAEAGQAERVEPLDADGLSKRDKALISQLSGSGGGGISINVNPSAGMDENALAEMVSRKIAFQMKRGSA